MTFDFDRVIDRRDTESAKWARYGPNVLPLWVADMDFASPPAVIEALRARVEHGLFGYGYKLEVSPLHEVFAERLAKRYSWRVSPEAIVMIPGVIVGFNLAGRILAAPGDGLLLQTPVYPPPLLRVPGNARLTLDEVPLARGSGGTYGVDRDAVAGAIGPRTRMLLLCNPHNPVGRVFSRAELTGLAEICLRHGVAICADEIHGELVFEGHQHVPIASLDEEIAQRTITLMAPSKTFNLPGLKCGLAIIPDPALRQRFTDAWADLVTSVNILGYTAALAAYPPWDPTEKGLYVDYPPRGGVIGIRDAEVGAECLRRRPPTSLAGRTCGCAC
jgi:cysteine-S-conjugate beta-lyase